MCVSMALPETGGSQTQEKHIPLLHSKSAVLHGHVFFRHRRMRYPVSPGQTQEAQKSGGVISNQWKEALETL